MAVVTPFETLVDAVEYAEMCGYTHAIYPDSRECELYEVAQDFGGNNVYVNEEDDELVIVADAEWDDARFKLLRRRK